MIAGRAGLPPAATVRLPRAMLARTMLAAAMLAAATCASAATPAAPAAAAASAAPAESLYVIEQLVINVNSAPDASGERIATVKSGERVAVIERLRDQVHVRLANGVEGWIRASYLSADEPLRPRLVAREAELSELRGELTRLQGELEAARTGKPAATASAANSSAATGVTSAEDTAVAAPPALFAPRALPPAQRLWTWVLGASLVSLLLGVALGVALLDRHIRRKYGGLRIY